MYCPNCGNQNTTEQKFCRKCGMNLEASAESLMRQTEGGEITPSDRRLEVFGSVVFSALGVIGALVLAGLVYTMVTRFVLTGEAIAFGIVLSLLIIFGGLALAFVVLNEGRKEKQAAHKGFASQQDSLSDAPNTAKLIESGHFEPVPSVVDDTTELLKVEARTRKL